MTNRRTDMQTVFAQLSEENKDIMVLIAKSMKAAKEAVEEVYSQPEPTV